METNDILGFLKYTGFVIPALAGVWALIAKPTFEDETGRRRLTVAGHISVAIIIASALVSMLAYGFETLAKQDADSAAAEREARRENQEKQDRHEAQREVIRVRERGEQLALIQDANRRADVAQQRGRDLELAQRVAEGSAANLARTQVALRQMQRMLNPIGILELETVWELPPTTSGTSALLGRLEEFGRQLQADPRLAERTPGVFVTRLSGDRIPLEFQFDSHSPFFPSSQLEPELNMVLSNPGVQVSIYRSLSGYDQDLQQMLLMGVDLRDLGDIRFSISAREGDRPSEVTTIYRIGSRAIQISLTGASSSRLIENNGHIVSILDLEVARLAIAVDDTFAPSERGDYPILENARRHLRLRSLRLHAASHDYEFRRFRSISTGSGVVTFFVDRIGAGIFRCGNSC